MSQNPHIRDQNSPLETLMLQALRRHGEFSPGTIAGDVASMFLEFANTILEEVRNHVYAEGTDLVDVPDYVSITDARPVPDEIIKAGLLFHYMMQQRDQAAGLQQQVFTRTMNQRLWFRLNGNTKIRMRIVDGGTHQASSPQINPINGLAVKPKA